MFSKQKAENCDFIKPWSFTRYKDRGGLVLDTRLKPYNRGNTVQAAISCGFYDFSQSETNPNASPNPCYIGEHPYKPI